MYINIQKIDNILIHVFNKTNNSHNEIFTCNNEKTQRYSNFYNSIAAKLSGIVEWHKNYNNITFKRVLLSLTTERINYNNLSQLMSRFSLVANNTTILYCLRKDCGFRM